MFTGLIETTGIIKELSQASKHLNISIEPKNNDFLKEVKIGDSININGACQTVTHLTKTLFKVFTTQATLELSNFKLLKLGEFLNLEKSLKLTDRLDGHFVYGHVEAIGNIVKIKNEHPAKLLSIQYPEKLNPFLIKQGSIAVNGVSLTIFHIDYASCVLELSIIPETIAMTNLNLLKENSIVNIECDPFSKYIYHQLQIKSNNTHEETLKSALIKNGFIH